jgi:hypothetical protein
VGEGAAVLISARDGSVVHRCPICGSMTTVDAELVEWLGSAVALAELGGCECSVAAPGGAPPGGAGTGALGDVRGGHGRSRRLT